MKLSRFQVSAWRAVVALVVLFSVAGFGCTRKESTAQGPDASRREQRAPGGAAAVAVIVAPARREKFAAQVEAIGTTRANEAIDVTAKVSNRITAIRFREGQQVKAGDVLVEFDGDQARAALAEADAALGDSRSQFNRSRELYQTHVLSQSQLDQLEATFHANEARVAAARSQVNDTVVRAPFAGRVGLRNVSVGAFVAPGAVITTLDDTSVVKLDFAVPEVYLSALSDGLPIEAHSSAYPDQSFRGRIASVDSRVDPASRSIVARAILENRTGKLKPGMFMTIAVVKSEAEALLVPEQALVPEGDRKFVFAAREGKARKTEVQIGRRRPGQVEILSGIAEQDLVVIEGTQKIRDGSAIRFASERGTST
jgi:membrane fusion protein (multidrug efflux system)